MANELDDSLRVVSPTPDLGDDEYIRMRYGKYGLRFKKTLLAAAMLLARREAAVVVYVGTDKQTGQHRSMRPIMQSLKIFQQCCCYSSRQFV